MVVAEVVADVVAPAGEVAEGAAVVMEAEAVVVLEEETTARRYQPRSFSLRDAAAMAAFCLVLLAGAMPQSHAASARDLTKKGVAKFKAAQGEADVQVAIALFRQALRADSRSVPAHAWLGAALMESQSWEANKAEAIREFERVEQLDPADKQGYVKLARSWLLKLRGRPKRVLFAGAAGAHGDFTAALLGSLASGTSDPQYARSAKPLAQKLAPDAALCQNSYRNGVGWVAVVQVTDHEEPHWVETKIPFTKRTLTGYQASVTAKVRLLDAASGKQVAVWAGKGSSLKSSASEAGDAAIKECGGTVWTRTYKIMVEKDKETLEDPGMSSITTRVAGVYAKAGTKDRYAANSMPILLLLPVRNAATGVKPESKLLLSSALDTSAGLVFQALVAKQAVAVVPPRELAKLKISDPRGWSTGAATAFARKLGPRCRWVAIPEIAVFDPFIRESGYKRLGVAKVTLRCTLIDVGAGGATQTLETRQIEGQSKDSGTVVGKTSEEWKTQAVNDALAKVSDELTAAILAKVGGRH